MYNGRLLPGGMCALREGNDATESPENYPKVKTIHIKDAQNGIAKI